MLSAWHIDTLNLIEDIVFSYTFIVFNID